MAFIQYCPPSPKAGIQEHVSRDVAAALISAGFAKEVVLSEEEKRALRFGVPLNPPPPPPPTWSVFRTPEFGDLLVQRKQADGSTTRFNSPPPDCPDHIAKQFAEMRKPGEQPASYLFAESNNWRERIRYEE